MVAPEEEDEASKTEEPSERKITKAKEEGDVAISQDAKSFIMLTGMLFVVWLLIPLMLKWYYQTNILFIENAGQIEITPGIFEQLLKRSVLGLFKVLGLPFVIFMVLAGASGYTFSFVRSPFL